MSVVACTMYRIEVGQKDILPVLVELELLDVLEPVKPLFPVKSQMYHESLQRLSQQRQETGQAIEHLKEHFSDSKHTPRPLITSKLARKIQSKSKSLEKVIAKANENIQELDSIEKEIELVRQQRGKFKAIKHLKTPVFNQGDLVKSRVLVVDKQHYPRMARSLKKIQQIEIQELTRTEEAVFISAFYQPEFHEAINELVNKAYCQELAPSIYISKSSSAGVYQEYSLKLKEFQAMAEQVRTRLQELSDKHLSDLETYHDLVQLQENTLELFEYVGYSPGSSMMTNTVSQSEKAALQETADQDDTLMHGLTEQTQVHIDGWIDPEKVPLMLSKLEKLGVETNVTELDVSDDPEARTVLKNNRLMRPFEVITNLMGTPHRDEIDPSPYVAPFFVLFFGFALGDAGYGLLMMAVVLYMFRKREQLSEQLLNVLGLVFYCGLSTTVFGALTGSWFGLDLTSIGQVGQQLAALKVIDMQSNIILLLVASLVVGYIHQLFGLILAIKSGARLGKLNEALQTHGTWLLLLTAFGFAGLANWVPAFASMQAFVQPVLIVSAIFFVFGQGYGSPVWVRPFKGALSFLNITSYLSNTLSYARLLALGLATGVIASVVNMIALMAGGELPLLLRILVIALVAVIGHLFNIALNLLGTFINVARLHLVEFFPKFFEAKGSSLNPLHSSPTYSFFDRTFSTKDLSFEQFKLDSNIN
jgi:vacuolar-type H+-ATPase subunit I/STV1